MAKIKENDDCDLSKFSIDQTFSDSFYSDYDDTDGTGSTSTTSNISDCSSTISSLTFSTRLVSIEKSISKFVKRFDCCRCVSTVLDENH